MCEPRKSGSLGAVGLVTAFVAGVVMFETVKARQTHPVTPARPVSAPSVAHSGFPWVTAGVSLALVAVFVVGMVLLWRRVRPRLEERHERLRAEIITPARPVRMPLQMSRQRALPAPSKAITAEPVRVRVRGSGT